MKKRNKINEQRVYKFRGEAYCFSKVIIYNLDKILEGTTSEELPKDKKSIEKFLHKAIDGIFCELNIFITRKVEGCADKWVKDNKPDIYSNWIKNNSIYTYYIMDSEKFEHCKVNETLDLLIDFMVEKRGETLYRKYENSIKEN